MCFLIDQDKPTCSKRHVWKVLRRSSGGYPVSPTKSYALGGRDWAPGAIVTASDGPRSFNIGFGRRSAAHGIYVYLDEKDALSAAGYNRRPLRFRERHRFDQLVVVALTVSPSDFLFQGITRVTRRKVATYRRVKVDEVQPWVDWV